MNIKGKMEGQKKCYQEIVMAAPSLSHAVNVITKSLKAEKCTAPTVQRI